MNLSAKVQNELNRIANGRRPSKETVILLMSFNREILQWQHGNQAAGNPATVLAKIGGVNILLDCIDVLSNNGALYHPRDKRDSDCYEAIRTLCVNASNRSLEFCEECGECGLLDFYANELSNLKSLLIKDSKTFQSLVYVGFSILKNCSKSVNNIKILDELNVVSLATEYIEIIKSRKFPNSMELEMCCSILLAYTMDEDNLRQSDDLDDVIEYLVQNLNVALSKPDHRFSGYHADELISAIQKFAKNEENGLKVVEEFNEFGIFSVILKTGFLFRGEEKLAILSLLCQLSFSAQLKKKIAEDERIMQFLRETSGIESNRNNKEKQMATLTLFVLESNSKKLPDRSLSESSAPMASGRMEHKKLVILSFEKQSRSFAVQIKSDLKLKFPGCDVYLKGDDDYSDESLNENEVKTFQRSDASLLLLTKRYQNSLHCRAVAEYLTSSTARKTTLLFRNRSLTSCRWIKTILDNSEKSSRIEMKESYNSRVKNQVYESLFSTVHKHIEKPRGDVIFTDNSDDFEDVHNDGNDCGKHFDDNKNHSASSKSSKLIPPQSSQSKKLAEVDLKTSSNKHVMLSYQHQFQPLVLQIRRLLDDSGYKTWMDMYDMGDNLIKGMQYGVENSAAFIMCMSKSYQNSKNCQKEAMYASEKLDSDDIIPIYVEKDFKAEKWLEFVKAGILYMELTSDTYDDDFHEKLVNRLGKRGMK